jgi:hypothetical protein
MAFFHKEFKTKKAHRLLPVCFAFYGVRLNAVLYPSGVVGEQLRVLLDLLILKAQRGAGKADGANQLTIAVPERNADAFDSVFMLHVVNGITLHADFLNFLTECLRVGYGVWG